MSDIGKLIIAGVFHFIIMTAVFIHGVMSDSFPLVDGVVILVIVVSSQCWSFYLTCKGIDRIYGS